MKKFPLLVAPILFFLVCIVWSYGQENWDQPGKRIGPHMALDDIGSMEEENMDLNMDRIFPKPLNPEKEDHIPQEFDNTQVRGGYSNNIGNIPEDRDSSI